MTELSIPVDERMLSGRLYRPRPRGALLFIHGHGSSQRGYAERARAVSARLGLTCLTFDLGGHGNSTGDRAHLTPDDHLIDTTAAYDRLAGTSDVDPARIGVCGASYGAYLACMLIAVRPVRRLLLRAPALPADTSGPQVALDNLRAFDGGTLVLESGADEVVSPLTIEAYLMAARRRSHRTIEGASHALRTPEANAAFIEAIVDWFRDL
jgi:pimeloyl-ACP methyl ester carboxylesterase